MALGAFAELIPGLTEGCGATPLETLMWGKVLYHARISDGSAAELASMPPFYVKPVEGSVPAPVVSYSGSKAGYV